MIVPEPRSKGPTRSVLKGILLLARGRADGLGQFGNSREAVLGALAPLAAFLLVGATLGVMGGGIDALVDVAEVTIGVLGPLVLTYEILHRLGLAASWPRYAAAFCWCQWAAPLAFAGVLLLMAVLMAAGLSGNAAAIAGLAAMFAYGMWLHWFLAQHALGLPPWRAMALVVVVELATTALIVLPQAIDYMVNGLPPG